MAGLVRRMIVCSALAGLVSSCGWFQQDSGVVFEHRAREVAARWQGSADDRAWRAGFVALRVLNPRGWAHAGRIPAWVNRSSHNGAWELAVELPAESPAHAEVRWPDGGAGRCG